MVMGFFSIKREKEHFPSQIHATVARPYFTAKVGLRFGIGIGEKS